MKLLVFSCLKKLKQWYTQTYFKILTSIIQKAIFFDKPTADIAIYLFWEERKYLFNSLNLLIHVSKNKIIINFFHNSQNSDIPEVNKLLSELEKNEFVIKLLEYALVI